MTRSMIMVLIGMAVMTLGMTALAQETTLEASKVETVAGTLKAIDTATNMLTITNAEAMDVNYTITAETKIMVDAKEAKVEELKAGQMVKVELKDGAVVAVHATNVK